jgi:hypothetical protein
VAALKGLLEGFRCFCWEAGLEPEELLAWSLVGARAIDGAAIHLDREVAPNESWAAQTVELFRDWFPTLASRGTR